MVVVQVILFEKQYNFYLNKPSVVDVQGSYEVEVSTPELLNSLPVFIKQIFLTKIDTNFSLFFSFIV